LNHSPVSFKPSPSKINQSPKEVSNTDSSLRMTEGALNEAQDYVQNIFSKTKIFRTELKKPFVYSEKSKPSKIKQETGKK